MPVRVPVRLWPASQPATLRWRCRSPCLPKTTRVPCRRSFLQSRRHSVPASLLLLAVGSAGSPDEYTDVNQFSAGRFHRLWPAPISLPGLKPRDPADAFPRGVIQSGSAQTAKADSAQLNRVSPNCLGRLAMVGAVCRPGPGRQGRGIAEWRFVLTRAIVHENMGDDVAAWPLSLIIRCAAAQCREPRCPNWPWSASC
jgi:hypothetical protein